VRRSTGLRVCGCSYGGLLPGQATSHLSSPPEGLKDLADSLRAQTDIEFQQFTLNPLHAPEQVIVLHAQDHVLDFCVDRLTASFDRPVFKGPKPLQQCSLPGEDRFRLDQRQLVLDVSCPVQDNEEQLVVDAEFNPLLPDPPQQDLVFLLEQSVL
jgi:hypothetical protein